MRGSPYVSYLYSYPHKTAYRPLAPVMDLAELWRPHARDALFLYLHIPYCEMRCGFCNLFTSVGTDEQAMTAYLEALGREAARMSQILPGAHWSRVAIGGGTPTLLSARSLDTLLTIAERTLGAQLARVPVSVETSPMTATEERLRVLVSRGVDRISIGVQSFEASEVRALGRAQSNREVCGALERIRESGVAIMNIDLMYGTPGQTVASWLASLERALAFAPEELYLYPLYVRALTGMARSSRTRAALASARTDWDHQRLTLYRAGRAVLLEHGYTQVSMRMFRRAAETATGPDTAAMPVYRCQEDGMVGLGAGARSYTDTVHYSTDYAVGAANIKSIIRAYIERDERAYTVADYGFDLDPEDRRRRFAILSLLSDQGLDEARYRARFGSDARHDLPELVELLAAGLAQETHESAPGLILTERGLERADAIGPWLCSARVRRLMDAHEAR
jgi:oxygen-independent coproporphyrinogen-3 oxidase